MACVFGYISTISTIIVVIQVWRKCFPWIFENIVGPMILGSQINFNNYGDWALITGATDGIGKSYAKLLAKKGKNVVLVSRTKEKLEAVASEIETKYNVQTKIIAVDFTHGPEIYTKIEKSIEGLSIKILVNNVGVSYTYPEYFSDVPNGDKLMADIINCNIISVMSMCKLLLPVMLRDQNGIIINVASMAGTIPNPLLTIYSASKAFVNKFSEDLSTEYGSQGIVIQSVLPGFVATNMTRMKKSTVMTPSADQYVAATLRTLGHAKATTGYFPHALMQLFINTMRTLAPNFTNKIVLKQMEVMRSKALKRINKTN